jgi:ABC-type Mn2+/Zn2+ transport system permease subunit
MDLWTVVIAVVLGVIVFSALFALPAIIAELRKRRHSENMH